MSEDRYESNKLFEAISIIIGLEEEIEAVQILLERIKRKTDKLEKDNAEMSSCLRAIKKINKSENMAIDALCDRSDINQKFRKTKECT